MRGYRGEEDGMRYETDEGKVILSGAELVFFARRRSAPVYRGEEDEESGAGRDRGFWRGQLFGHDAPEILTGAFSRAGYDFVIQAEADDLSGGTVSLICETENPKKPDPETVRQARGEGFLAMYLLRARGADVTNLKICFVGGGEPLPYITEEAPTPAALTRFFTRLCDQAAVHAAPLAEREIRRRPTMVNARFPYREVREGQAEFMETVHAALRRGRRLYASAPTGIGKTISVLYPAVRALGEGHIEKIFYLTPKNTVARAAADALRSLRDAGADVRGIALLAKDTLCPCEGVCKAGEPCRLSPLAPTREDAAVTELLSAGYTVVESEELLACAEKHRVCPSELGLRYSLYCDVVIGDYNYLFDPRVALKRYFDRPGKYAFLVDEAHNLVERVRKIQSTSLSLSSLARLAGAVADLPALREAVASFTAFFEDMMKRALRSELREEKNGEKVAFLSQEELPEGYLAGVCELAYALLAALPTLPREARLRLRPEAYGMRNLADRLAEFDRGQIAFLRLSRGDLILETKCLDPAAAVDRRLSLGRAAVLFSATLSPLSYYREVLGGRREDMALEIPSPFDESHLAVAVMDRISTRYSEREDTVRAIVRAILTMVKAKPGNYMVFCPSYRYLIRLHDALTRAIPGLPTLLQTPGMSQAERAAFLARFDTPGKSALVGFCVMGGIYSEGIDLVGRRLIGAVVVGVGLPQLSDEREAIAAYFQEKNEHGREYAYVYPGMNRVLQAAGRVIRSEEDRGAILLIDDRFGAPEYRKLLPAHWRGLHFVGGSDDLAHLLAAFWKGK